MHYDHVTLVPGHLRVDVWDDAVQDTVAHTVRPKTFMDIAPFFRSEVHIEKGFTLGHLFELLDIGDDVPLLDIAVGDRIGPLLAEVNRKRRSIEEGKSYKRLEVYSEAASAVGESGKTRYAIRQGMRAVTEGGTVSVDLVPTYVLRDVPLCYQAGISFYRGTATARKATGAAFEGELAISFLELVQAVFWELSFYGAPEERDAVRKAMEAKGEQGGAELLVGELDEEREEEIEEEAGEEQDEAPVSRGGSKSKKSLRSGKATKETRAH